MNLPVVIRDNNEQIPLEPFVWRVSGGEARRVRLPTRDESLETGDYSLPGLSKMIAVERKSVGDLWSTCFGDAPDNSVGERQRSLDRFRREMSRMQWLARKWILVEGSKASLMAYARERYDARACRGKSPEECVNSLLDILAAIQVDYGVPVEWAGSREGAEAWVGRVLLRVWDQHIGGPKAAKARARGLGLEELPWLAEAPRALDEHLRDNPGDRMHAPAPRSSQRPRFAEAGGMPLTTTGAQVARSAARRCR